MRQFIDAKNRTWEISVNFASVKRIRDLLSIDILDLGAKDSLSWMEDPIQICNILWCLVKPQAEKIQPSITDEDFGAALSGEAFDRAFRALTEDLSDFTPNPASRKARLGIIRKAEELTTRISERVMRNLESPEFLERAEQEILNSGKSSDGSTSTKAPELSDATSAL